MATESQVHLALDAIISIAESLEKIANPPIKEEWETDHIPVLSLAHIQDVDEAALAQFAKDHTHNVAAYEYGYFVYIGGENFALCSDVLRAKLSYETVYLFAHWAELGHDYIRLDRDASEHPQFKTFDW
jgi:hypothetical protein